MEGYQEITKESVKETAIEVKDVCIYYQMMKNVTVRHNLSYSTSYSGHF